MMLASWQRRSRAGPNPSCLAEEAQHFDLRAQFLPADHLHQTVSISAPNACSSLGPFSASRVRAEAPLSLHLRGRTFPGTALMASEAMPHQAGGSRDSVGDPAVFGVLTVSDRASGGVYRDLSGPAILQFLGEAVHSEWEAEYRVVPDEQDQIEAALKQLVDEAGCLVVVTTGGTGPAPRDVTPEATQAVCSRMMPGFGEQMRAISLRHVPTAILSRQTAGVRGKALIINLPGKPKAIRETIDEVFAAVPYCIDILGGPYIETNESVVKAFRPPAETRKDRPAPS